MRILIIATVVGLATSPALAICEQRLGNSFEEDVQKELDRLICLHNVQTELLNSHSAALERYSQTLIELQAEIDALRSELARKK